MKIARLSNRCLKSGGGYKRSAPVIYLLLFAAGLGLWLYLLSGAIGENPRTVNAAPAGKNGEFINQEITPTITITEVAITVTLLPTPTSTPTAPATATPMPLAITTVEPERMSTAAGGVLTVLGQGFTPDTVIRLVGYGLLNTTFVNHTGLTGVVPPGVPPGRYDVQVTVGQPGGATAAKADALLIEAEREPTHTPAPTHTPIPTATPTATPTTAFVFGQPQLTIQAARTAPQRLQPGEPFELILSIANRGNWTAVDAVVEMQSTDLAVPDSGSNVRLLSRLAPNEVMTATLSLVISENAPQGPQNLAFQLHYFDINGRSYSGQQSVGLFIGEGAPTPTPTAGAAQPLLLLTTYTVEPEAALEPGHAFDLLLTITNAGDVAADAVIMRLGGEGGRELEPFILLDSGNVRFLETVAAGQTLQVAQKMMVAGTAAAGVYTLPIDLTYRDGEGRERQDNQIINLLVQRTPLLQVNFYRAPGTGMVGQPLNLPVEVVNIGRTLINVSNVTLSNPDVVIENNSVYIGPLDGGTSGSLDGLVVPTSGGELPITVTVHYLDDFNQPQQRETILTVMVNEPAGPPGGPAQPAADVDRSNDAPEGFFSLLWRFLKGILGLGS